MKSRILVTGSTGFVGRQVVNSLASAGAQLRLVLRDVNKFADQALLENVDIVTTPDLFAESVEWWRRKCADIDVLVHLAWHAEPGEYLNSEKNMDCLVGSLNMAKGSALAGVKRFVGIGTCFEYDLSFSVLAADTPIKPLSPYAAAKAALYLTLSQTPLPSRHLQHQEIPQWEH